MEEKSLITISEEPKKEPIIDKFDIEILYCLSDKNMTTPIESFRVKDIIANSESESAYYTYVNRLKKLIIKNYVKLGYKAGNANTYYITKDGIEFLEKNIFNLEGIYEDEEE